MANFTVTEERKEKVDFANPYMKLSFGVVSPDSAPITSIDQLKGNKQKLIVAKGTTAETYFTKEYPDIELLKFDQYTEIFAALKDGRGRQSLTIIQNSLPGLNQILDLRSAFLLSGVRIQLLQQWQRGIRNYWTGLIQNLIPLVKNNLSIKPIKKP